MSHQIIVTSTVTKEERGRVNKQKFLAYLNEQLKRLGQIGEVKTVLTYSKGHKKVSCYGHWIPDGVIVAHFNISIGVQKVSYPSFHELTWPKSRHGDFVRLQVFEPQYDDDLWVALFGFPIDPNCPRLRFSTGGD